MNLLELLLLGLFGILLGSGLNMLTHKLPIFIYNNWKIQCELFLYSDRTEISSRPSSLEVRLNCQHCQQFYSRLQYIAFLSLLLGSLRCVGCKNFNSLRGLLIEFLSCSLVILITSHLGINCPALCYLVLFSSLLLLAVIDYYHYIVPDCIVLPLLWLGLIANTFGLICNSETAILGASVGYSFLWLSACLFKIIRGYEGVGRGDMKLLAAIGAWLGAYPLIFIVLAACSLGIAAVYVAVFGYKRSSQIKLPFALFLSIAVVFDFFLKDLNWRTP